MNHVFLVPKELDSWSKNVISGEISAEKNFLKILIAPKDSAFNFRGSLLNYFWAIVLISVVMNISEDFGSLLPARAVSAKDNVVRMARKTS